MYARAGLRGKTVDFQKYCRELDAEFCGMEISRDFLVIVVYRSSRCGNFSTFLECFDNLLYDFTDKYKKIVVLGDFNIHFDKESNDKSNFLSLINSYGLEVTISDYTRVSERSKSCLDNILTTFDGDHFKTEVIEPCLSDHYGQVIYLNLNNNSKSIQGGNFVRVVTDRGLFKMKECLNVMDMGSYYGSQNVEYLSDFVLNLFSKQIDKLFPLKKEKVGNKKQAIWFDQNLRSKREMLTKVKLVSDITGTVDSRDLYRTLRREYNAQIKIAKKILQ